MTEHSSTQAAVKPVVVNLNEIEAEQIREVDLLPLRGDVRLEGGHLATQQGGQVIPTAAQAGQLALVELAQRGDHLLARAARRAHRTAKIPIPVTGSPNRFGFAT
jgi:hypothetical protein